MNGSRFTALSRLGAILVVIGSLFFSATTVFAGGNGATSFTQTFHNATDSFASPIPCIGPQGAGVPGTITITYNGVLHFTVNKAGDFWGTGTQTGTAVAVPDDPSLPTYTGHFTTWFGVSDNNQNGVEHSTFSVHATGTDGSTIVFHETMHLSTSASGAVVSFDKPVCN